MPIEDDRSSSFSDPSAIELAEVEGGARAKPVDTRPPMPEPPPVRLLAVMDVSHLSPPGVEKELDALYVGVLKFERQDESLPAKRLVEPVLGESAPSMSPVRNDPPMPAMSAGGIRGPVYRAERHRVCFEIQEPPITRDDLRPTLLEVPSMVDLISGLTALEIEFTRQRGLVAGHDTLLFQDAAGNWLEVGEQRPI